MIRRFRSIAAAILLLLLATPALAQGGRLVYHDDAGMLDRSRVQSAAQPLINRGATVAVYAENSGGDAAFQQRLEQDGLANGALIRSDTIAIFVSLQSHHSPPFFAPPSSVVVSGPSDASLARTSLIAVVGALCQWNPRAL